MSGRRGKCEIENGNTKLLYILMESEWNVLTTRDFLNYILKRPLTELSVTIEGR